MRANLYVPYNLTAAIVRYMCSGEAEVYRHAQEFHRALNNLVQGLTLHLPTLDVHGGVIAKALAIPVAV